MRHITLLTYLLLITTIAIGQKYALIDRNFKLPILYTDSVTISQVSNKFFPIRINDLDSVIANVTFIKEELKRLQRAKFRSYKLSSGLTNVVIVTVSKAYGDSYDIFLTTSAGIVKAEFLLGDSRILNKKKIKVIDAFISYIKNDKALVIHDFIQYTPTIFDATVFIPSK